MFPTPLRLKSQAEKIKGTALDSHLDMLVEADATLGLLMEELKRHGELENTLILFTSDNGGLARGPGGKTQLGVRLKCRLEGQQSTNLRGWPPSTFHYIMGKWEEELSDPASSQSSAWLAFRICLPHFPSSLLNRLV